MKRRIAASLVPILLFLLGTGVLASELPPYHIDSWQVKDGLPQSSVLTILQANDGYLWIGTAGGLVRFDGVNFKVFTPSSAPGLPSNRILSLFEDQSGALWIGTMEGYLVRYFRGQFKVCTPPNWVTLSGYIQNFAETPDGKLWLVTPERKLVCFPEDQTDLSTQSLKTLQTNVNFLTANPQGQVWTASDSEVGVWQNGKFTQVLKLTPTKEFSPVILAGSRTGGCWVAADGQLRKYTPGGCVADYGKYPWTKGNVVRMVEDHQGRLWVGTYGSGVYCYGTNGVPRHFSREDGLPSNFIRSLCVDREGNLWVGMEGAGLARIKRVAFQSYGRKQGLSGDCVMSICQGAKGELWIGLLADGVERLKDGVVTHYGTAQGLPNDYVHSVFYDRNHQLWVGTWGGGLCRLEGNKFVPFDNPGECSGIVCALYQDPKGDLWVGQERTQPEIVHFHDGRPVVFRLRSNMAGIDVRTLVEDRNGWMWIGTQGDGIYRIKGGKQCHYGLHNGLSCDDIRSFYLDKEGVLWIGTFGGGLDRYKDGHFTSFTTKDGLVNDSLASVLEDDHSNLWCGSLAGVFRVSKKELNEFADHKIDWIQCLSFTESDGLPSMECNGGTQPSGCKTHDGRLWFPTVRGLAVVDPDHIPMNRLPPLVAINELVLEGKNRKTLSDVASSTQPQRTAPLKIAAGTQRLEFHYTGLSMTEPKKVRFQYKLEGLEKNWVEAGTRRTAYYGYLPPGKYRFRVRACNNDGVWNNRGVSLALIILPYFWQTWWFKVLCLAAAILLLVGIYEMRLASERKLARIRLRIAGDLHDEVGSNLGSIALLSEMVSKTGEEADEIRRIALRTVSSLREIVWFLDPAGDDLNDFLLRMKDTARTMLHNVPFEFLSEGKTGGVRLSLNLRRNVYPMFKEILHNIVKHSKAGRVTIQVNVTARQFQLQVQDNGAGFDEKKVRRGNGLKNLRRRTAELQGRLEIRSQPRQGSHIIITAPLT